MLTVAGGTLTGSLITRHIVQSSTTPSYDVGSATNRFRTGYFGTSVIVGGKAVVTTGGGNILTATFGPSVTNTIDLGTTTTKFRTLYVGTSIVGLPNTSVPLTGPFTGLVSELGGTLPWTSVASTPSWMSKFSFSNTGPSQYPVLTTNDDIVCFDSFTPSADYTYNMGQDGLRFKYIYAGQGRFKEGVSIGPILTQKSFAYDATAGGNISLNADFLPDADALHCLGSTTRRFVNAYVNNLDASSTVNCASLMTTYISSIAPSISFLAPIEMGTRRISGLQDPAADADAVGKLFMQTSINLSQAAYDADRQYLMYVASQLEGSYCTVVTQLGTSTPFNVTFDPTVIIPDPGAGITISTVSLNVWLWPIAGGCSTTSHTLSTSGGSYPQAFDLASPLSLSGGATSSRVSMTVNVSYSYNGTGHKHVIARGFCAITGTTAVTRYLNAA